MNELENLEKILEQDRIKLLKNCSSADIFDIFWKICKCYDGTPPNEMNLIAIKKNIFVLTYIQNPSEELKLEAIKLDPIIIGRLLDPSEELQLAAVKLNPLSLKKINCPTEKVVMEALEINNFDISILVFVNLSKFSKENLETIYNNIIIKDIIE